MASHGFSLAPDGGKVRHYGDLLRHETISLLRRFDIRAKRDLGQNFLIDSNVLDQIIAAADLSLSDIVLEVGPGLGILTRELAKRCRRTVAVEVDPKMIAVLAQTMADLPNVTIVEKDVLETDPIILLADALSEKSDTVGAESYKVVANLPYYITSVALRHFLEAERKPRLMVLTIQKEVAERIVAKPGDMSLLAVSVQVYGSARIVAKVSASSFLPAPKVDSAILRIDVYDRPAVEVDDIDAFFRLVQAGFSQPRKQLHNAINQRIWLLPGKAQDLLRDAGIEPSRRAGSLSLEEWARFYETMRTNKEEVK
ncbi:MAG: 16S rRNA (adenine(1518)-N(6)/adenine(1519)-N(6))-dimethyltransferase RsmA [Dehalococcoidia bacterium]|nr:16S rRNA (adenine(1518)-N(6)/adenine(1519)-N(6))-dimethyltransferase RsmA [Dehalococcoidia bacterium]